MVKLAKYDKTLKRDVVVETTVPAEINQLRNQGFKTVKPKPAPTAQSKPAESKKQETK